LIPRTKVNYRFGELLKALFVSECSGACRAALAAKLRELLGLEHVLLMPSGRAGLYFLLKSIDRPRVIVPAYTCKAVVEAAQMAGKEVIFAENDDSQFNSPLPEYEKLIRDDCVVIATHQFGIPCEIQKICALAQSRGSLVIEDAAASLGSKVGGRLTGTFGTAAFFSFDSTKLINVPMKGGAIATKDLELFRRVHTCYQAETGPMPAFTKLTSLSKAAMLLLLEQHLLYRLFHLLYFQARGRFTDDGPGLKLTKDQFYLYGLAEWQAAIALHQMDHLADIVTHRQSLYAEYRRRLASCKSFLLPPEDKHGEWACIRFPIRISGDKLDFYRRAAQRGLDFAFSFTFLGCPPQFGKAHALAAKVLDLPFYPKVTRQEMDSVITILTEVDSLRT
jgi:dTDP-4-amino-4,6-dideoxygalactose transaminase